MSENTFINLNNFEPFIVDYWLYFEQYVYFVIKKNNILIYNELNNSLIEYSNIKNKILLDIIERFDKISDDSQVIGISEQELNSIEVRKFIEKIRNSFSGDIIKNNNNCKPLVIKPAIILEEEVEYMKIDEDYLLNYKLKLSINELTINTGLNKFNHSKINSIFKEGNIKNKYTYDIYKYLIDISHEISQFKELRKLNIICYNNSNKELLLPFINSIKSIPVILHIEISLSDTFINYFGDQITYCIYLQPIQSELIILEKLLNKKYKIAPIICVSNYEELELTESLLSEYPFEVNLVPIWTGNNLDFQKEVLCFTKEDLINTNLTIKDILINGILNRNFFGKIYINENGYITTTNNSKEVEKFNLNNTSILDFVYDQLKFKKDWFLIRPNISKCKNCIFNKLCPPLTFNDIYVEEYSPNFCNLLDR